MIDPSPASIASPLTSQLKGLHQVKTRVANNAGNIKFFDRDFDILRIDSGRSKRSKMTCGMTPIEQEIESARGK